MGTNDESHIKLSHFTIQPLTSTLSLHKFVFPNNTRIEIVSLNWDIENTNKTVFNRVMLTKDDLGQIKDIVTEIVESKTKPLSDQLKEVEMSMKKGDLDIRREIFTVNAHLDEHDKRFNKVDTKMKSLEKNIKTVVNFFDRGYLELNKRVERVEHKLGLPIFVE